MSLAIPEQNGTPSRAQQPATRAEIEEMFRLVTAMETGGEVELARCVKKRAWLRRGIAVANLPPSEVPAGERPFLTFYDRVHEEVLRRLFAQTREARGSSAWTAFHTILERLNRDEYGKYDQGAGGGVTVVVIERPPRAE